MPFILNTRFFFIFFFFFDTKKKLNKTNCVSEIEMAGSIAAIRICGQIHFLKIECDALLHEMDFFPAQYSCFNTMEMVQYKFNSLM